MALLAVAAKPAILAASAGIALGAAALLVYLALRRGGEEDGLLPRLDVHAYNDALLSP